MRLLGNTVRDANGTQSLEKPLGCAVEVRRDLRCLHCVMEGASHVAEDVPELIWEMVPVDLPTLTKAEEEIGGPAVGICPAIRRAKEDQQTIESSLEACEVRGSAGDLGIDRLQEGPQVRRNRLALHRMGDLQAHEESLVFA
jgi:hypothetical protein